MGRKSLDRFLKTAMPVFMIAFFLFFMYVIRPYLMSKLPKQPGAMYNTWKEKDIWEFKLYVSNFDELFLNNENSFKELKHIKDLKYFTRGYSEEVFDYNHTLKMSSDVINNHTFFYFIVVASPSRCNFSESIRSDQICTIRKAVAPAIRWERKRVDIKRNLIKEKDVQFQNEKLSPLLPFAYLNLTFDLVFQNEPLYKSDLFVHNYKHYKINNQEKTFSPPLTEDKFMHIPVRRTYLGNTSLGDLVYRVKVTIKSKWLWNTKLEMDFSYAQQPYIQQQWEDLKRALWDTNPLLLWSWIILTFAHIFLKVMAFKEDIAWWIGRDSLHGVSVQSVVFESFSQVVIFFYLKDEDTSPIVLLTRGVGLLIELWKLTKLFKPTMEFPYFKVKDASGDNTREFDKAGGKYLSYILTPMLIIYAIYSLFNHKYKSFYSYVLKVTVGAIYAFGFLAMLPQIYINYKLKSVAGMSGSVLAYKFVSTFIDDLFAFVMTMPLMHRISCFRDDIVFFMWLYQRRIYRIDPTRTNEYGETLQEEIEKEETKKKKLEEMHPFLDNSNDNGAENMKPNIGFFRQMKVFFRRHLKWNQKKHEI